MEQVNVHEAKTNLCQLIAQAANGVPFVIEDGGKPIVKVSAYAPAPVQRIGFLRGMIQVPDDFDVMGRARIQELFEGGK